MTDEAPVEATYAEQQLMAELRQTKTQLQSLISLVVHELMPQAAALLPYAEKEFEHGIELLSIRAISDNEVMAQRVECQRRIERLQAVFEETNERLTALGVPETKSEVDPYVTVATEHQAGGYAVMDTADYEGRPIFDTDDFLPIPADFEQFTAGDIHDPAQPTQQATE